MPTPICMKPHIGVKSWARIPKCMGKSFSSLDQLMSFQMSGGGDRLKRLVGICRYNEPPGVTRTALFRLGFAGVKHGGGYRW